MLYHLNFAEEFQQSVVDIEKITDEEVTKRYGHRLSKLNNPQEQAGARQYFMKKILAENVWYTRAVGNRNYHMEMAKMYGIAALVNPTQGTPIHTMDPRLVR